MKQIITITDKDITGSDMLSQALPRIAVNGILYDENGKLHYHMSENMIF